MSAKTPAQLLTELIDIMKRLREPDGCPWDRKQTHESLIPYLMEESSEAAAVIDSGDLGKLPDELGDILLQVVFHARIGEENGRFDMGDVIGSINRKLKRRHPHVFGNTVAETPEDVVRNWERIKAGEETAERAESILDTVPAGLPPLLRARKLQARAAEVGFDWDHVDQVRRKVLEEWDELHCEITGSGSPERIEEEYGDLMFALVNFARFLDIQPDEALRKANAKFQRRFRKLENRLGGAEKLAGMSLQEMDREWDAIKAKE